MQNSRQAKQQRKKKSNVRFQLLVGFLVGRTVHIAYRILHCPFLCPPTDLPLLRAALTTSSMNVEDAEFYDNNLILLSMIIIY